MNNNTHDVDMNIEKVNLKGVRNNISMLLSELVDLRDETKIIPEDIDSISSYEDRSRVFYHIEDISPERVDKLTDFEAHSHILNLHNSAKRLKLQLINDEDRLTRSYNKKYIDDSEKSLISSQIKQLHIIMNYLQRRDNYFIELLYNYSLLSSYNSSITLKSIEDIEEQLAIKAANSIKEIQSIYNRISDKLNNTAIINQDHFTNIIKERTNEAGEVIRQLEDEAINRQEVRTRKIEKSIEQLERNVDTAEAKINESLRENIGELTTRARQVAEKNIENINKTAKECLSSITTEKDNSLYNFQESVQSEVSSVNDRINTEVSEFENKKKEIIQILGDISTAHQSNANRNQADKEKEDADKFRKYGLIGLICVILLSIWLFNDYIHIFGKPDREIPKLSELGISWFTLRFMTITLLTAPCIYMLKESASHRAKENLYRQRGTQLSSIGAYLDELRPEERAQMKKELATNFFSFHDGKADVSNVPDFLKNLGEAVKLANSIKTPSTEHTANTKEKEKVS